MSGWRHPALGSEIDRSARIRFTFDGLPVYGYCGDTLASALMAGGHRIVGRSFKVHRPRGIWGLGAEEPNAVFDVRHGLEAEPNARGTLTPAAEGMTLRSVNAWPNARRDWFGALDLAQRFLPAGFYYKTFMRLPWRVYEPVIRRMAGLGRVDPGFAPAPDSIQSAARCDVLVIGAGPAGLSAARVAAEAGRTVWLVEEAAHPGGALRWRGGRIEGTPWRDFVADTRAAIEAAGGRLLTETALWGAFDHATFAAWQRGARARHWRLRAGRVILAAGAIERPLWFPGNDRPGVLSAEAALHALALYGAVAGRRILLAAGSDRSLPVAEALRDAGAEVTLLAPPGAAGRGDRLEAGHGRGGIDGATVSGRQVACDTILCSGGVTPSVHLWCQAGGTLDMDDTRDMLVPRPGTAPMTVIGAANGTLDLDRAVEEGLAAGAGASPERRPAMPAEPVIRPDPTRPGRQWIDLQNDVTLKDVALAAREGFTSVEHLKRYTTLGMATDQGRLSNFAGLAALADLTGRSIAETGTTTYRPPVRPVPLTALAGPARGPLYHPPKRLTLEAAHRQAGARFRDYGGWLRPAVYGAGSEERRARAEALAARETVGLYDASPLGKLEVIGPGAAELLDFTGYMRMSTLPPGRARYGFMLSEAGVVFDDGVVIRLDEDRFLVSASSSHVDAVRFRLEDARQDRIGRRRVYIHDLTQSLVTLSVTGPKARDLLQRAGLPLPSLRPMQVADTAIEGMPLRIARVSFTGDLSYELSVPREGAEALRQRLDAALGAVGGTWIGLEAVMILRAEKGFILVGKDTDGSTLPMDLGWPRPRETREDEYLGKRALFTPEAMRSGRRQLVGLRVPRGGTMIRTGSHLVPTDGPRRSLGFVTSSYQSPILERPIALALLEDGLSRIGQTVRLFDDGVVREARVTAPCAFDPKGERLHG